MIKKIIIILLMFLVGIPALAKDKIEFSNDDYGIFVFKIDTKKYGDKIKPFMAPVLTTPKKVYDDNCFDLVVNGGFFDVKNGKTVSYVVIDEMMVGNVRNYPELTANLEREGRLEKVLSRGELRIYQKNKKLKFDITYHDEPVPKGYILKHSLQAGPILAPEMDLEKEGFVVYEGDKVKSQSVDI